MEGGTGAKRRRKDSRNTSVMRIRGTPIAITVSGLTRQGDRAAYQKSGTHIAPRLRFPLPTLAIKLPDF